MEERLEEIKTKGLEKINQIKAIEEVQEITRELTGKKSELNDILRTMGSLSDDMKKTIGIKTTEIKNLFMSKLKDKEEELINAKSVVDVPLD